MNSSPKYPEKSKLVVCLSRFPWPIEKGDKLRAYYQLRDLSQDFDIYLICTNRKAVAANDYQKIAALCQEVHVFELRRWQIVWNLLMAVFSRTPFQIALFTQQHIRRKIDLLLERIAPDHIYCQLIRPAEYVKNYHACHKTIDLMDALSKGMERRISKAPRPLRFLYREESKRLINYERRILDYFEKACIISQQDKDFILHPNKERIAVIPNGVDSNFFSREERTADATYDLVFVGNMQYPPNVEAAIWLAKTLMPALLQDFPRIRLLISGASPVQAVRNLASKHIEVSGWVDDIRDSYAQCRIFVAPMLSGTGMQNKLLEALAMGLPCVTTSLANNAILAKEGEEILIADNLEGIKAHIILLLNDQKRYAELSAAGRAFVQSRYNWQRINEDLGKLFSS